MNNLKLLSMLNYLSKENGFFPAFGLIIDNIFCTCKSDGIYLL